MQDAKRVFFHELGHFIAHEINKNDFGVGNGVGKIIIAPHPTNPKYFEGFTKLIHSSDERERKVPALAVLPEYLASSIYGCIFQAYYKREDTLNPCVNFNGANDLAQWSSCIAHYKLEEARHEFLALETNHLISLLETSALDEFMALNPLKYLEESDNQMFDVDVSLLRADTSSSVLNHSSHYKSLVYGYRKIMRDSISQRSN